jgi:hypothetical protein
MAVAAALASPKAESAKMGLLEDDDEFKEFDINQGMHPATPSPQLVMAKPAGPSSIYSTGSLRTPNIIL